MDVRWAVVDLLPIVVFLLSAFQITSTFKQGTCYFPERWEGAWFQSGVRSPVIIDGPRLSTKGRCLGSDGDKFLMVDEKRACYRCVVIHEKHKNVLQYKETFCHGRDALPTLCSLITGDALLYSLFRENASPVSCPFRGPFTFTYNRGHGECRSPVSNIDTCTEDSKLLLSYQACPDIYGSESTVEELQCLASWKEGSVRYLVGQLHHNHVTSNEDRFRCFVYEKTSASSENPDGVDYRVAQSGDATCNGLFSATEGSRTMTLRRAPPVNKCRFPSWLANYNHWHTLDYSQSYSFHHRNSTLRISNSSGIEMKVVCVQVKHSRDDGHVVLVTHFTMGCQSGFSCMSFYRRDGHVAELQTGSHTKRSEDACNMPFFNKTTLPFITLVTSSSERPSQPCPYTGKFDVSNLLKQDSRDFPQERVPLEAQDAFYRSKRTPQHDFELMDIVRARRKRLDQSNCGSKSFSSLVIGCNKMDTMEFNTECTTPDLITAYSCHGRWEENGTSFLITSPISRAHGSKKFCFMYKEISTNLVAFSSSSNCNRMIRPGITGELIFNVTNRGRCMETSGSTRITLSSLSTMFLFSFLIKSLTQPISVHR
ncbi:uncharacterized protein LOC126746083 [Anthonomus grandis grandis]|uniref:uncharacterized protein LOC126746083 n=1 Tax=Anthonomus grandis grandis TaxID=2921223 RepID=UPI002166597B|nr:uncharacterized protein LOC126746083 [Anthonomus grandis grandis]XP_050310145.1 uncharacterized protein LOC126746083 [Anthonomus grandis grandis]